MSVAQKAKYSMKVKLAVNNNNKEKIPSKMSITCMTSITEQSYLIVGSTDQSIG